jgi:hypothetical protein
MDARVKPAHDGIRVCPINIIIPALAEGQNPKSSHNHRPLLWIPGSREERAPE